MQQVNTSTHTHTHVHADTKSQEKKTRYIHGLVSSSSLNLAYVLAIHRKRRSKFPSPLSPLFFLTLFLERKKKGFANVDNNQVSRHACTHTHTHIHTLTHSLFLSGGENQGLPKKRRAESGGKPKLWERKGKRSNTKENLDSLKRFNAVAMQPVWKGRGKGKIREREGTGIPATLGGKKKAVS